MHMRDTITANVGYVVRHLKNNPDTIRLYDGDELLFQGTLRTYEDYVDECVCGNDETAVQYEVFTTVKGNQFVYWRSEEFDEDYLTKIVK